MFCEDKKCLLYIECMERLEALPYCASKAAELATTANQQLKAEILLLLKEAKKDLSRAGMLYSEQCIIQAEAKLSAV